MHHPTDRIAHTTAFVTPVVEHRLEGEISQWVHPMKDRSDDPSHHEQTLKPRSYISLSTAGSHFEYRCVSLTRLMGTFQLAVPRRTFYDIITPYTHRSGGPMSYFHPVLQDWSNKGCGMCYPVCKMMHIKEPLLLMRKSSPCGSSGFPLSLSEWSFNRCLMPYNHK